MKYRQEHDSMGEVLVEDNHFWGAQTQRSLENFQIGTEKMPSELIEALVRIKKASAEVNFRLEKLDEEKKNRIVSACDAILEGNYPDEFPLSVWQTGSGTQTNMNVNEVIAHIAGNTVHPNDHVNMSQSSNDVFPAAINLAVSLGIVKNLMPAVDAMIRQCKKLEKENAGIIKSGRTHLMDATPVSFSEEISGWRSALERDRKMIRDSLRQVNELALGGTAVGTGINAPKGFDRQVCGLLSEYTGISFEPDPNKFRALSMRDSLVFAHGALKSLGCDLMKIANDVRWMASGPRCGLGEITIPANEPGSSIMPGKVNPTQCEAVTMAAVQVMGNDVTVSMAASQGNFELNVFGPVIAYNMLQSIRLLGDVTDSFTRHCLCGLKAKKEIMEQYLHNSLMSVTALSPVIGYEKAAEIARYAHENQLTLKEACMKKGYLSEEEFNQYMDYRKMV